MKRIVSLSAGAVLLAASGAGAGTVHLVCNAGAGCPAGFDAANAAHHATMQDAATAAQSGDTILVWPGTYKEQVHIRNKNDLLIRGMDRYGVVFDGDVDGDGSYAGNHDSAIKIGSKGDPDAVENVTIENMSGAGYFGQPFFWENVHGYWGRYLTAYNSRRYGIYSLGATGDPANPSVFENNYVYGHGDGGFYIGECSPCNAVIRNSWAEWNALGYSGTNAGGNLVLEETIWNNNRLAILPNTLDGESNAPQRGIIIRNNHVFDNNFATSPLVSATALAPVGIGIGVAGGMSNQIYGNRVHGNGRFGIITFWFFTPAQHNMVFSNVVYGNGADFADQGGADLSDGGPGSLYNCFTDNETDTGGEPTTEPPNLQELNSCRSNVLDPFTVPAGQSPRASAGLALAAGQGQVAFEMGDAGETPPAENVATPLTAGLSAEQFRAVQCMANPCAGLDDGVFCSNGTPAAAGFQSAECAGS